jgi:hypothetical protein
MTMFRTVPAEMLGLFVLVSGALTGILFPEISDFWLALATAIALFVIMHVRTHLVLDVPAKEKPSP